MPDRLPSPHIFTCPKRAASLEKTLLSWAKTDWPATPRIYFDGAPEKEEEPWGSPARALRLPAAFASMLERALEQPGVETQWLLLMEDDLEFHPRIGSLLRNWPPLHDPRCVLASLFNPSLPANPAWPGSPRAFAAQLENFLGAQALLLRRSAARRALARWNDVQGLTSQRLVRLLGGEGPVWVHRPSLVQHVATESSWGARVQQALDFNPNWSLEPDGTLS